MQNSSTLMRNNLKLQFNDVVEWGSHSKKKYEHLGNGLQKLRHELLTIDDDCDKNIEDCELGSADGPILDNQVLSNITFMLQDHVHVPCNGRPKSLRQKHPKEKQATSTRTCSICKKQGRY
jgi:hypothetical protein